MPLPSIRLGIPLFALLASLACGHRTSQTIHTEDGTVTVNGNGRDGSVRVNSKDGKVSLDFNSGKPVADYPADVPIYKGTTVFDARQDDRGERSTAVQTSDTADTVLAFYKRELAKSDWKVESTVQSGDANVLTASKGNRSLAINISEDSGKRSILQNLKKQN